MAKVNVTASDLIELLRKRGRPIRAGNNNLPGYLGVLLGYASGVARDAIRTLLQNEPEGLVVEFFDPESKTRVKLISLPEWVGTGIEYEDLPMDDEELLQAYAKSLATSQELQAQVGELVAALEERERQLTAANADLEAAESLLDDKGETDHSQVDILRDQNSQLRAEMRDLRSELSSSERKVQAAQSARQTALDCLTETKSQHAKEIEALRERLDALQADAANWGRFVELSQMVHGGPLKSTPSHRFLEVSPDLIKQMEALMTLALGI